MAFIATLSTVEGLRAEVEFIDDLLDKAPWLVPVFEIGAPFFVIAANSLLPIILEGVSLLEGPISGAMNEASLFSKLVSSDDKCSGALSVFAFGQLTCVSLCLFLVPCRQPS